MSDRPAASHPSSTGESSAGAPVSETARQPLDEELDQRDRDKAGPRRAAGPPLAAEDPGGLDRAVAEGSLPDETEPLAAGDPGGTAPGGSGGSGGDATHSTEAGPPADHVGPKPSGDELDRRDRLKAGPRRAAGPPLRHEAAEGDARALADPQPPPTTDPDQ